MLTLVKVGLGLSVIFLGVRVGGDIGHWMMQSLFQKTPSTTGLS